MSKGRRHPWTEVEVALLRWGFADSRTDDMARALGRSYSAVAEKAARLGLRKSADYLSSPEAHRLDGNKGAGTRFKPGAAPWNAGKPGSTGTQAGCRATQFKKGARLSRPRTTSLSGPSACALTATSSAR